MRVIGVIDLRSGQAVRARGGNRAAYEPVHYVAGHEVAGDPVALARVYHESFGLEELYVADLDAITSGRPQVELLRALTSMPCAVWVDAGISSPEAARELRDWGVSKVIVGLETLPSYEALDAIVQSLGSATVVFSLDLKNAEVVLSPNSTIPRESPAAVIAHAVRCGIGELIVLDLARVGLKQGLEVSLMADFHRLFPDITILAGGGIRGPEDLRALQAAGCAGALVATALHDGQLDRRDGHHSVTR